MSERGGGIKLLESFSDQLSRQIREFKEIFFFFKKINKYQIQVEAKFTSIFLNTMKPKIFL
jgi:hypothetical protein